MTLLSETQSTTPLGATHEPVAVYRHIAPVSAPVRGTTLPGAVQITTLSTVKTIDNTDMGANAVLGTTTVGRGRAFAGLGWQPVNGSEKRHGATRGRPPREHRKGLQLSPLGTLEAANPAPGIAAFLYG
ncbi:hypothetical protein [Glycomyces sp. YM15]|uniref:hypothetical protein n=1 Tax=Glycomyces sp. YM15 TaxID=2800446 RepID=UPI00196590DD|nr:hypothetical protein [Glycomyces sp. YM15]